MARFASGEQAKLSSFFFQPVPLDFKLTDLLEKLCFPMLPPLIFLLPHASLRKNARQSLQQLGLPLGYLDRQHFVTTGDLGNRLLFLQRFLSHLGLELIRKCTALGRHVRGPFWQGIS